MEKCLPENILKYLQTTGLRLLNPEGYQNKTSILRWVCSQGHEFQKTWGVQKRGKAPCAACHNEERLQQQFTKLQQAFRDEGYSFPDPTQYINAFSKLSLICPQGHTFETFWNRWDTQNHRCQECRSNNKDASLQAYLKESGFKVQEKYVDQTTHMTWVCPQGHSFSRTWKIHNKNRTCPICVRDETRIPWSRVLEIASKSGYQVLTPEAQFQGQASELQLQRTSDGEVFLSNYKKLSNYGQADERPEKWNQEKVEAELKKERYKLRGSFRTVKHPIEIQCPEGHVSEISFPGFLSGKRCLECHYDHQRTSTTHIKEFIEQEGYQPLVGLENYRHNQEPIRLRCGEGHEFTTNWQRFRNGGRCPACRLHHLKDFKLALEKEGYSYLTGEWDNARSKLEVQCDQGHKYLTTHYAWAIKESRCPFCASVRSFSRAEVEILEFVQELGLEALHRCRIGPEKREVDIFVPSRNLAIEYCGLYWHSNSFLQSQLQRHPENSEKIQKGLKKVRNRHRQKLEYCKQLGVRLLTIFEDEYTGRPETVRGRIQVALQKPSQVIPARKLKLVEDDRAKVNAFFKAHHLQGLLGAKANFSLQTGNGQIVAALSLGVPGRRHVTSGYEIKRVAFLPGVLVLGGFERLLQKALEYCREQQIPELISYCDLRYGTGDSYRKAGFELQHLTGPTPQIVFRNRRLSIQQFRGEKADILKAARKVAIIYDCGHQKWVYKLS